MDSADQLQPAPVLAGAYFRLISNKDSTRASATSTSSHGVPGRCRPTAEAELGNARESSDGATEEVVNPRAIRMHTLLIEEPQSSAKPLERLRRAPDWAVVVNNISFMAVPRSIPANFAATGWVIGTIALVYSSVVTYDTGLLIGQLCQGSEASSR